MKIFIVSLFILCATLSLTGQSVATKVKSETKIDADTVVGIDNFGALLYVKNNTLYKRYNGETISYNNFQLGTIRSAQHFNPLKINVFYGELNTAILLDNRLAEIFRIDFNALAEYRNVSHISTGFDNTIWLFNQDALVLELFDYKKQNTIAQTLKPIDTPVIDITSNYNYCYVLTQKALLVYNYFGSITKKIPVENFDTIREDNDVIYLKKNNSIFYLKPDSHKITPINTSDILVSQFFVTNETLYLYNGKSLIELQLTLK